MVIDAMPPHQKPETFQSSLAVGIILPIQKIDHNHIRKFD